MTSFLHLTEEALTLTVPRNRFTDTVVRDSRASLSSSDLGQVQVHPWGEERIAGYRRDCGRWDRVGRHAAPFVLWLDLTLGSRPRALRLLAWLRRVLCTSRPADRTCMVVGVCVDGRGWLDDGGLIASAPEQQP